MLSPKGRDQTNQTVRFADVSGEKKPTTFALQTNKLRFLKEFF